MEGGSADGRRRWLERFLNQNCLPFCNCTADHGCTDDPFWACSCKMDKFLCIDCQSEPLCRFTVLEHQKQRHQVLHVASIPRISGDPAIQAEQTCGLDITGIKRFEDNGKSFVYLNRSSDPVKNMVFEGVRCIVCGRILGFCSEDQAILNNLFFARVTDLEGEELVSIKFCCISCKWKGSAVVAAVVAGVEAAWKAALPSRNAPRAAVVAAVTAAWKAAVPSRIAPPAAVKAAVNAAWIAAWRTAWRAAVEAGGPRSGAAVAAAANKARIEHRRHLAEFVRSRAAVEAAWKAALPGDDELPAEGAHESETEEEERIPCKSKGSAAVEARAEAAGPSRIALLRALPGKDVLAAVAAHERDKGETEEQERIPPDEGQAQVEKRRIPPDEAQAEAEKPKKLLRLFGRDIWC